MTIQTDISQNDWAAFARFITRNAIKGMTGRLEALLVALVVGLVGGAVCSLTGIRPHAPSVMLGLFAGLTFVIALSRLRMRRVAPAPDGITLGPRQVSLDDEGLRATSQQHESVFRWHTVRSAEVTPQHVFVMVDRNAAVIMPRRAFPSQSQCEQFVSEVRRRSGEASA